MQAHSNNTSKDFKDFLEVVKKMEAQSKGWAPNLYGARRTLDARVIVPR